MEDVFSGMKESLRKYWPTLQAFIAVSVVLMFFTAPAVVFVSTHSTMENPEYEIEYHTTVENVSTVGNSDFIWYSSEVDEDVKVLLDDVRKTGEVTVKSETEDDLFEGIDFQNSQRLTFVDEERDVVMVYRVSSSNLTPIGVFSLVTAPLSFGIGLGILLFKNEYFSRLVPDRFK